MITTRLYEVYKALGLAHARARESEAWTVVYERVKVLTSVVEELDWMLYTMNLRPPKRLKDLLAGLAEALERGSESEAFTIFESTARLAASAWRLVRPVYGHVMAVRVASALTALAASVIVAIRADTAQLLAIGLVAIGLSIASLILSRHPQYPPAVLASYAVLVPSIVAMLLEEADPILLILLSLSIIMVSSVLVTHLLLLGKVRSLLEEVS